MRPPLRNLSCRVVIQALRKAGFLDAPKRGKGSHRALVRQTADGTVRLVIVPERRAIVKQAGLTVEEFQALLGT